MRFIKYLFFITGTSFFLSYSLFLFINYGLRNQKNDTFPVIKELVESSENHQVLFFGSSLSKNNINPLVFDSLVHSNSYNFGYPGAQISHNYMLFNRYLHSHHPTPKKIVLVLEPWILDSTLEINFPVQYYPYYRDTMIYNYISLYDNDIKMINNFPFLGITKYNDYMKYLGFTGVFFPNRKTSLLIKGFEPLDGNSWRENGVQKKNTTKMIFSKSSRDDGLRHLENICKKCKEKDVQLYLLYPPTYHSKGLKGSYNSYEFMKELSPFVEKYNVKQIDHSELDLCQNRKLFFDTHHLNKSGASVYSKIIASALND